METAILVLTNLPDVESADRLARHLVETKLAACVNRLPEVHSVYRWNDAVETATETTLLIKTTLGRYQEMENAIRKMHPYEIPEIIAIPITAGLSAYLTWIDRETARDTHV